MMLRKGHAHRLGLFVFGLALGCGERSAPPSGAHRYAGELE